MTQPDTSDSVERGRDEWLQTQRVRFLYADKRLELWSLKKGLPDRCIEAFDQIATAHVLEFLAGLRSGGE